MLTVHKHSLFFSAPEKFVVSSHVQKKCIDNGVESVVLVHDLTDIGSPAFSKQNLPDPNEYTYENLIKAGVPLQEVPSKIFDYSESDIKKASDEFSKQADSSVPVGVSADNVPDSNV